MEAFMKKYIFSKCNLWTKVYSKNNVKIGRRRARNLSIGRARAMKNQPINFVSAVLSYYYPPTTKKGEEWNPFSFLYLRTKENGEKSSNNMIYLGMTKIMALASCIIKQLKINKGQFSPIFLQFFADCM